MFRYVACVLLALLGMVVFRDDGTPTKAPKAADFPAASAAPSWIWFGDKPKNNQVIYFRKEFEIKGFSISAARLYATCDNEMTVYINGREVLKYDRWQDPVFKDVFSFFATEQNPSGSGRHVIAVRGKNIDSAAGLLMRIVFDSPSRQPFAVITDATWRASDKELKSWNAKTFDDNTWPRAVVVGKLGDQPWVSVTEATLAAAAKLREPTATPPEQLKVAKDFKVELLYSVPKETQGSWVCLCVDPKGNIIASDQYGALYRVTPPALGGKPSDTKVERLSVKIGEAQGLLWAFDSLYVVVNSGRTPSGLYRVTDSNGDGELDKVELLRKLDGNGEHGPHAVLLGPDGKSLYIVCGNHTPLTAVDRSLAPRVWKEDFLLPRMWDPGGHAVGILAPGGWIARTDPEGKRWELVSIGYRNQYDAAFNEHGDLFTYDSDMEWDINAPWYRPTRVCLAVSGSEFGWRSGSAIWPAYFPDSLPAVVDIGPGSPTGVTFGYGAKFPAKYQQAFFMCDWSYGKLYALHLTPEGAAYRGEVEEFISGSPLPLTDIVVNPKDGAMYFAIGGRLTKSGLYRVTYVGSESTMAAPPDRRGENARALRRQLEALHGQKDVKAVDIAWPCLGHADRYIRFAARTALEHQDPATWADRALAEKDPQTAVTALLALIRVTPSKSDEDTNSRRATILSSLDRIDWAPLTNAQRLELLRVYGLCCIRLGRPDERARQAMIARFAPCFPASDRYLNAELCQLLVYLEAPGVAEKAMALLAKALTQEEQLEYATSLRVLKTGWTPELRRQYFSWFIKAGEYRGGMSFRGFINQIKKEAVANLTAAEKANLKPILEASNAPRAVPTSPPRPFVKNWKMEDLALQIEKGLNGRNIERGRALFSETRCFVCHRFDNDGGAQGPDLTSVAGRFSPRDLLESILEPSKVISDQYTAVNITTLDGKLVTGRIVNLSGDSYMVMTDMYDPSNLTHIDRRRVETVEPSKVSMMPAGLVDMLKEDEILDLMAYLLSRGGKPAATSGGR